MESFKTIGPTNVTKKEFVKITARIFAGLYARMLLAFFVVSLAINLSTTAPDHAFFLTGKTVLGLLAVFAVFLLLAIYRTGKVFEATRGTFQEVRWELLPNDLKISNSRSESELPWPEFSKCSRNAQGVILRHRGGSRFFMPLRAFRGERDVEEVTAWIQDRIQNSREAAPGA
jgi:hypothetical protein